MSQPLPLRLKGVPGSPYTRKMLALLRYRHLEYRLLLGDHPELPRPRVPLLPTFYLQNDQGELEAVTDSTPLIRRFEQDFGGRAAIPDDPVVAFIDELLEDYGDEWLTRAMFHYRWHYQADIDKAARILPIWRDVTQADSELASASEQFAERQISRLHVVGSNATTAPVIEASYQRFLTIMEQALQRHPFLMGDRPGAGDFAVYAQLTQLAKFDPTPMTLCLEHAPRVFAWVDIMDDLSGWPSDAAWLTRHEIGAHLGDLLAEVGRVHVPTLQANAVARAAGEQHWETRVDGEPWTQPVFPYQAKCWQWLRESYQRLDAADQEAVAELLAGTGCEALIDG